MPQGEETLPIDKQELHPRSLHRIAYDFRQLIKCNPELEPYVKPNPHRVLSIDFSERQAVKQLNKALLRQHYNISYWDFPSAYLCPPVPGRADHLHYLKDLLDQTRPDSAGKKIRVLDIGTGANCIYPILGNSLYNWNFTCTDIDRKAILSAEKIIAQNPSLTGSVECRLQKDAGKIFAGVISAGEKFDLTICNPPFHASSQQAQAGTALKWKNLGIQKTRNAELNFGGQGTELYCPGGEAAFIGKIIAESAFLPKSSCWFTSLVSKKENLAALHRNLEKVNPSDIRTIEMEQGNKISRIIAWTFHD